MKTWYQVLIYPKVFGFSVIQAPSGSIRISNHPERAWEGVLLQDYKKELINQKAEVYKIC